MTIAILQALLTVAGCFGLWRTWRALEGRGRTSRIITAGFLIRAFGAQVLFWISWLRLPIARPLQLGDGFWFFALDGTWYLGYARDLLGRGAIAILFIGSSYASRIFTQWFTLFAGAFGPVASTGILLNCFLYFATCALILHLARRAGERVRDFALAAIAFGPATILWSLQLLKDTFFVFLIVGMVVLWSEWQRLWRGEVLRRWLSIAICGLAMWYAVYAISGTRWYVGAMVAGVSLLFLGLVANLPRPRFVGSFIAVVLFLTLGQAFLLGGDFDVPLPVRAALDVRALFHPRVETEAAKVALTTARRGFQTSPGATMIRPGPALIKSEPKTETIAELPVTEKKVVATLFQPAPKPAEPAAAPAPAAPAPAPAPVPVPVPAPTPVPVAVVSPVVSPPPPPPAPVETKAPVKKHKHQTVPATPPKPAQVIAKRPKPPRPLPPEPPQSLAAKIATGAAAMFLPRVIAQAAGLVRIGGGRGFWLFADFDTLIFDLVVFVALALCVRGVVRKERRVTPLFLLVLLVFAGLTGPMIYSVTNFGTLFRLREMIYVFAVLLPLTLDPRASSA